MFFLFFGGVGEERRPEEMRHVGRRGCSRDDNIKIELKVIG